MVLRFAEAGIAPSELADMTPRLAAGIEDLLVARDRAEGQRAAEAAHGR